jgi:glycosyltransferase involved in cell wall biosynthesis
MLISIIIPIYNVSAYIQRCINSCLQQTNTDFEIIAIDDCGYDNSIDLVRSFQDPRITIIHHQYNQGLSVARNTGLKHASGKYVLFLDSDDYIAPHLLKLTVQQAELHELDFVSFNSVMVNEEGELMTNHWMQKYAGSDLINLDINHIAATKISGWDVAAWSKLIRRAFLIERDILFDEEQKWFEDHHFSAQLYCLGRFSYLNHTLHYYFQRSEKASQKSITQEKGNKVALYRAMAVQQVLSWLADSGNSQYVKLFLPLFIEQYKTILITVENDNVLLKQVYALLMEAFKNVEQTVLSSFTLTQVDIVYLLQNCDSETFQNEIKSISLVTKSDLKPWVQGVHCEQLLNYQNGLSVLSYLNNSPKLALMLPVFLMLGGAKLLINPKLLALKFRDYYIISRSSLFDVTFYQQQGVPSSTNAYKAIIHYVLQGEKKCLKPCRTFNPHRYLSLNPDLSMINMSLFAHYILYAEMEGRKC